MQKRSLLDSLVLVHPMSCLQALSSPHMVPEEPTGVITNQQPGRQSNFFFLGKTHSQSNFMGNILDWDLRATCVLDTSLSILPHRWKIYNKEVADQSKAAELEESGREVCGFELPEAASPEAQAHSAFRVCGSQSEFTFCHVQLNEAKDQDYF